MDRLLTPPIERVVKDFLTNLTRDLGSIQKLLYVPLIIFVIFVSDVLIQKLLFISLCATGIVCLVTLSSVIIKSDYFPSKELALVNVKRSLFLAKVKNVLKVAVE